MPLSRLALLVVKDSRVVKASMSMATIITAPMLVGWEMDSRVELELMVRLARLRVKEVMAIITTITVVMLQMLELDNKVNRVSKVSKVNRDSKDSKPARTRETSITTATGMAQILATSRMAKSTPQQAILKLTITTINMAATTAQT